MDYSENVFYTFMDLDSVIYLAVEGLFFKSGSRKVLSGTHPIPLYIHSVHPLSALNNFLPDPTVPAKFRSGFQNHTFKFPLLKEREIG